MVRVPSGTIAAGGAGATVGSGAFVATGAGEAVVGAVVGTVVGTGVDVASAPQAIVKSSTTTAPKTATIGNLDCLLFIFPPYQDWFCVTSTEARIA